MSYFVKHFDILNSYNIKTGNIHSFCNGKNAKNLLLVRQKTIQGKKIYDLMEGGKQLYT
jgi:hypothetical protein